MKGLKLLSLVVPAYKQEKTIIEDMERLSNILSSLQCKYEILVVVDGFLDQTYEILKNQKSKIKNLKLLGYEKNHGKGYAVKYGVREAAGDVIGFMDAGMDLDPSEISTMLNIMDWNKADIVLGSKLHPESRVDYPVDRKILSWGYRSLTHLLFSFNVRDTQVGLKFFRKKVAKDVFSKIVIKRFAFDVEVLAVSCELGYAKIYEAPIKLNFRGVNSITSTSFWNVIFWMLWDTFAIFYRLKILNYYRKT